MVRATLLACIFCVFFTCGAALAQALSPSVTPSVKVFFDPAFQKTTRECPGDGVIDTLYVVGCDYYAHLSGMEFRIEYPKEVAWITDFAIINEGVAIILGKSTDRLAIGFKEPIWFDELQLVCKLQVEWKCGKDCASRDIPIKVVNLAASDWPGFQLVPGSGGTSIVCPTDDEEE